MATDPFRAAFAKVVGIEGDYSNNPNDSGGETMFGITVQVARAHGYTGKMCYMPLSTAERIYEECYWKQLRLQQVALQMPALAEELFDSAVNCGINRAARWLQTALNALNKRGDLFADMVVDGRVGPVTLHAINALIALRGVRDAERALRRLCDSQQGAHYLMLAQARQKDEDFIFGWALNRLGEAA